MNPRVLVFSLLCSVISTAAFGQSETAQSCPADGQNGPSILHETWILDGWERAPGDPAFVFAEKLARYYDLEGPGVFYDDLAPDGKTARRAIDYGAMWKGHLTTCARPATQYRTARTPSLATALLQRHLNLSPGSKHRMARSPRSGIVPNSAGNAMAIAGSSVMSTTRPGSSPRLKLPPISNRQRNNLA